MKFRPILVSVFLAAAFAGCATFSNSELGQIRHSGVSPVVMDKFVQGKVLTPPDIIEATRRGVPDNLIVRQIEDADVDYVLTKNDIKMLEQNHVSPAVMDVLVSASNDFAAQHAPPGPPHPYGGYAGYPAYQCYDYSGGYPYFYPYSYYGGGVIVGGGYGGYGYGGYGYGHRRWR
jgi:hypothetical protein